MKAAASWDPGSTRRGRVRRRITLLLIVGALVLPTYGEGRGSVRKVSLYLHGRYPAGEAEMPHHHYEDWRHMDQEKPSGASKSHWVMGYGAGPDDTCSPNGGWLPVWLGEVSGRVTGRVILTIHTVFSPDPVRASEPPLLRANLFGDGNSKCGLRADPPDATTTAVPEQGEGVTKLIFRGVDFRVRGALFLQLDVGRRSEGHLRVVYDGNDAPSSLRFSCEGNGTKPCTV
jgi:hypothetical protein